MKKKVAGARWVGGVLAALLGGCGGQAGHDEGTEVGPPSGDAVAEASPLGWSVRDAAPYARHSHSMVIDTASDRLLVFGGAGNDAWQLPLSGAASNSWQPLLPEGDAPPPGDASAVYDPAGQRVLARFDRRTSDGYHTGEIWELDLLGTPTWQRLDPGDSDVEAEISAGMVALDAAGQRLFVVGGDYGPRLGTWSLSLTGEPTWTRWDDTPAANGPVFLPEFGLVVFDAPRERLVAMPVNFGEVWEMPLATGTWSMVSLFGVDYGATAYYDDVAERVVFAREVVLRAFSLASHEITELHPQPALPTPNGAVFDGARGRALFFSADDGGLWQLPSATVKPEPLLRGTRPEPFDHSWTMVWDEARRGVVAFGGDTLPEAHLRSLSSGATWQDLRAGAAPRLFRPAAAYDAEGRALVAFGGRDFSGTDSNAVWRLASKAGSRWQQLAQLGSGPEARSGAVGVYDSSERRLLVRGGEHDLGDYVYEAFDDVWALSLDANTWTKLEPTGDSPGARFGETGVYDSGRQRLIVYGGYVDDVPQTDVHALTLGDAPSWGKLEPSGQPPPLAPLFVRTQPTALYDSARARLLLVVPLDRTTEVWALELADQPSWHRFCALGPAPNLEVDPLRAVLASDGIWVARSNGAFRFNLETPYCD